MAPKPALQSYNAGSLPSYPQQQQSPEQQVISQLIALSSDTKIALQNLLMVLKSPHSPEHLNQILQILKSNPPLMAAFIKQRQIYQQAQVQNQAGLSDEALLGSLPSHQQVQTVAQIQQQQQQQLLLLQQQQQQQSPEQQVISQLIALSSDIKIALQNLLMFLKSPHSPEHQHQILQILKSNPPLMAAFIKQRQIYQQTQVQNQAGLSDEALLGSSPPHQQVQKMAQVQQQQQQQLLLLQQQQQQQQPPEQQVISQLIALSSDTKIALQNLLMVLKSPHSPEYLNQILQILKSNPPLMAAFIKQRQIYQQAQVQNQAGLSAEALLGSSPSHQQLQSQQEHWFKHQQSIAMQQQYQEAQQPHQQVQAMMSQLNIIESSEM